LSYTRKEPWWAWRDLNPQLGAVPVSWGAMNGMMMS